MKHMWRQQIEKNGFTPSKFLLIGILVTLFIDLNAFSDNRSLNNLKFSHIGTREGLSHSWAKCMEKDHQGFLWVGTINGLNRYDGRSFRVFSSDPSDPESLSDNFIQVIKADSHGELWIGTYSGGLNRFNPSTESFKSYRNAPKQLHSLSDDRIHSILEDSRGRLWIGTAKGLDIYDRENDQFDPFYVDLGGSPRYIRGLVSAIQEDSRRDLWIGTSTGLVYLDLVRGVFEKFQHEDNNPSSLPHNYVTSIYEDENLNLWIGTWGGGICRFDRKTSSFVTINMNSEFGSQLSHNSVLSVSGNQDGQVYIGTEGGGLNILNLATQEVETYIPQIDDPKSINSNSIHSLHFDQETGITWVGSYHAGLNFFSRWGKPFRHYTSGITGLNNGNVLCIAADKNDQLFVGTDGGGINVINKSTGHVQYITGSSSGQSGILSNAVLSVLIDNKENLWVGTFSGGLDFRPAGSSHFMRYVHNPDIPNSLSDNDVSALCEASDGKIWIGTMDGGLNLFLPESGTFKHYRHQPGNPASLSDNFISRIFEAQDGHLFIQTGATLDEFDPISEKFHRVDLQFATTIRTPIYTIEDSRKNLWIGSREHLVYLNRDTNEHIIFTSDDGLPSNHITGILEDNSGSLWISTMRGLVKFSNAVQNPERRLFEIHSEEDGLQANDFKDQACYKGDDGTLYFGGQNGFNAFLPSSIRPNPVAPKIAITSFKLFNKDVEYQQSPVLSSTINTAKEIHLTYEHNVFSFEFAALNFWLPGKNQYAYMMEGFESDWNYVGNQNTATYTNLNPGSYIFKIKASNNDGIWSDDIKSIAVHISPPWWKTNWFQFLASFFLAICVIAFHRIRLYQLKVRQQELTKEVEERTREITEINLLLEERNVEIGHKNDSLTEKNDQLINQNHELEAQSNKIQNLLKEIQELSEMKFKFFTNISHELRTPLTLILGPLEKLISRAKEQKRIPKELDVMHRNALKLIRLINQLLDFRKIESGNIQLKAYKNDIVSGTKEVFDTFRFVAEKKQIEYQFISKYPHYDLWFDAEKMEKILTNLLSNAFKYTPNHGKVKVILGLDQTLQNFQMIIEDTGSGIPNSQLDHIFDLYFQANNAQGLKQAGSGIGLALIKQYVELHHGEIEVVSKEGTGTTFRVLFPVGSGHLSANEIADHLPDRPMQVDKDINHILMDNEPEAGQTKDKLLPEFKTGEKPTLLIVEDNTDIREYIKGAFEDHFEIEEAVNGQEGLRNALDIVPDLIISDVMMPEMNGFIMCQQIKQDERTSHIPIVLLTAYSGEEKQWEGFRSGADDYVTKPFNIKILQHKLRNISKTRQRLIEKFTLSKDLEIQQLTSNTTDQNFLKKALDTIDENLTNAHFGVEDFSAAFNMSRRNLLRKLKSITGLSANEFIKNVRMKKSLSLFQNSDMNVSEVAYAVGFNDPKYFSKCFKEQFGKSPSEFVDEMYHSL